MNHDDRKPSLTALLGAALCLFATAAVNAQNLVRDWHALEAGEVLIEDARTDKGVPGLRVRFLAEASADQVWAMLLDYAHFREFFPDVESLRVLEEDALGATVVFTVDAVLTRLRYTLRREYVEQGHLLRWHRIAGDLEHIEGSWEIRDTPDPARVLLIYESYVDIGFSPITHLIRYGAKQKARDMAGNIRDWLARPDSDATTPQTAD